MMCVKIHKSYRDVVAICDSDLIGKKFEEGIRQLEIRETFFGKDTMTYDAVVKLMRNQKIEDSSFNIVGRESIKAAKEAKLITEEEVDTIKNIPFTLILA